MVNILKLCPAKFTYNLVCTFNLLFFNIFKMKCITNNLQNGSSKRNSKSDFINHSCKVRNLQFSLLPLSLFNWPLMCFTATLLQC